MPLTIVEYCVNCTFPEDYCKLFECPKTSKKGQGVPKRTKLRIVKRKKKGHDFKEIFGLIETPQVQEFGEKKMLGLLKKYFACSVKINLDQNIKQKVLTIQGVFENIEITSYISEMMDHKFYS